MSNETPAEVLAPCPFCGYHAHYDSNSDWVSCDGCGATGPTGDDQVSAIDAWNSRSLAAGKVATLPDGYRIEVQHGDEQWMTTAYTLVTPDKRRWSPAPMEPGYYLLAALSAPPADPAKASEPDLHPKTADLVNRFARALAEKLAAAEKKYGYSDGWASPDWMDECRSNLIAHVYKGDPRDVAAYCAFLWHHGSHTDPRSPFCEKCGSVEACDCAPDVWREQERLRLLRLRTLLDGFEVRLERNELQPPATYLDEVTLWSEMQPGQGRIVCEELRKILSEPVRVPATPPASAPEVTEEMVERACIASYTPDDAQQWANVPDRFKAKLRARMRAALTAALQQEGKSHG